MHKHTQRNAYTYTNRNANIVCICGYKSYSTIVHHLVKNYVTYISVSKYIYLLKLHVLQHSDTQEIDDFYYTYLYVTCYTQILKS